jgi:hypothetical protein
MALTFIDYTAPATYSFSFDYLDISNVKAYVNGVPKTQGVHYTVQTSPKAVIFTAGNIPAAGTTVRIRRETFRTAPLVDFNNGSTLLESDLDTALKQTLYINQETAELNDTTLALEAGSSNFTALDSRIIDLANPVNAKDATNKTYVDAADGVRDASIALKVSKAGDTMSGALAMGNQKITGLGTPTASADATTKTYVDTADALKVAKAGDTMSGNLSMNSFKVTSVGLPTDPGDVATKSYADSVVTPKVSKSGDSMTGALSMGSNRITDLASPITNTDAASRTYVDTLVANAGAFGVGQTPLRWSFVATANQTNFVITGATATNVNNYLVFTNGAATANYTFNAATFTITLPAQAVNTSVLVIALGYRLATEAPVLDGSVVLAKLAANSVDASKIVDGSVADAELSTTGVTAAEYGTGDRAFVRFTVNSKGRVSASSTTLLTAIPSLLLQHGCHVGNKIDGASANAFSTRLGFGTLSGLTTGFSNLGLGYMAGNAVTSGANNTCVGGYNTAVLLSSGNGNCVFGTNTATRLTTGSANTIIGVEAADYVNGSSNITAVGATAAQFASTTFAGETTAIGAACLRFLGTGNQNTGLGFEAGKNVGSGSSNTYVGYRAAPVSTGSNNVIVGREAALVLTSGNQNIFMGDQARHELTSGSNNVFIGHLVGVGSGATESNAIRLGNANTATFRVKEGFITTFTGSSDARDKKDILPLQWGLDFIKKMNPVTFEWNSRNGLMRGPKTCGFIAQELDAVETEFNSTEFTNIVDKSNPDSLSIAVGPSNIIPILVKAIQDLSAQVEELKLQTA